MAERVLLHVGCPKTGTAFLQGLVWGNRDALRRQGLLLPGSSRQDHYQASLYVRGAHAELARADAVAAKWDRLVESVHRAKTDVLISHELFALCTPRQAKRTIDALGGAETHVVITARDLARQIPASWQQGVKQGSTTTLEDFVQDVVHRGPRARAFWKMQDLVALSDRWARHVPASRVHVVTVPPRGADPTLLWRRFASVLRVDPDSVALDRTRSNESLGRVEAELMRRINELRADTPPAADDHVWFRDLLANGVLTNLADGAPKDRFGADPAVHDWIVQTCRDMVMGLKQRNYEVVGDLDDLVPPDQPERGRRPSESTEGELLAAALQTILDLVQVHRESVRRTTPRGRLSRVKERLLTGAS